MRLVKGEQARGGMQGRPYQGKVVKVGKSREARQVRAGQGRQDPPVRTVRVGEPNKANI